MPAIFLSHWFHFFYVPAGEPWYHGNVWGNVFVIAVVAPLGWVWSKTRFWPLRPVQHGLRHLHEKFDEHRAKQAEHNEWMARHVKALHEKHVGPVEDHPHFDL